MRKGVEAIIALILGREKGFLHDKSKSPYPNRLAKCDDLKVLKDCTERGKIQNSLGVHYF
jgi:hypothetical protein